MLPLFAKVTETYSRYKEILRKNVSMDVILVNCPYLIIGFFCLISDELESLYFKWHA